MKYEIRIDDRSIDLTRAGRWLLRLSFLGLAGLTVGLGVWVHHLRKQVDDLQFTMYMVQVDADRAKIVTDGIAGQIPIAQDAIRQHQIDMAQLMLSEAATDAKAASKELASAHKEAESGVGKWGDSSGR